MAKETEGKGMKMRKQAGFTLVELMITVAIIGILAAIVYPSYVDYMRRSHRAEAKTILMEAAQRLERSFTQNNSYTVADSFLSDSDLDQSPKEGDAMYDISLDVEDDGASFTLTADPVDDGFMATDACAGLTIDNTGKKDVTGDAEVQDCWNK